VYAFAPRGEPVEPVESKFENYARTDDPVSVAGNSEPLDRRRGTGPKVDQPVERARQRTRRSWYAYSEKREAPAII